MRTQSIGALGLCLALHAGAAGADGLSDKFSSFWVLGDSFSDTGLTSAFSGGTHPASPPYFDGRFSNGPVWADYIIDEFNAGRTNSPAAVSFAFSGATAVTNGDDIPDLDVQSGFLFETLAGISTSPEAELLDNPLFAIWFGANDVFAAVSDVAAGKADSADAKLAAENAAGAIGAQLSVAIGAGLTDLLLFNLPDMGAIPAYNLLDPDHKELASLATGAFNAALADVAAAVAAAGVNVTLIDMYAQFEALKDDPAAFGVSDVTLPCLFRSEEQAAEFGEALLCSDEEAAERAFFDIVHPSATIHAGIAEAVREAYGVSKVPLPASAPLLALGVVALGALRRRRQRG